MRRPYVKKTAPQHHRNTCTECDGAGVTQDVDYDEDGPTYHTVRCEACQGSGEVTSCDECGEVMSLPEAETTGYRCVECVVAAEMGDAEAERARIRRVG